MLPGFRRTFAAPALSEATASDALKWMSATTGMGEAATISRIASASAGVGTATRTISHPAAARRRICSTVAAASRVWVVVIDWIVTGLAPPIVTGPTRTTRVGRLGNRLGVVMATLSFTERVRMSRTGILLSR